MAIEPPTRCLEEPVKSPAVQGASAPLKGAAYIGTAAAPPPELIDLCRALGMHCPHCWTPRAAIQRMTAGLPELVFIDANCAEINVPTLCRKIRQAAPGEVLPIVIFHDRLPAIHRVRALRAGADEIIGPASDGAEARARLHHLVARKQAIERAQRRDSEPLPSRDCDGLTGLDSHTSFQEWLEGEVDRCQRDNRALAVIFIDIDHFKQHNATCGHPWGDGLLRQMAQVIRQTVRTNDLAARYGGDEFMIGLPDTDRPAAYRVAERILRLVAEHPFPGGHCPPLGRVTLSVGIAAVPEDATTARDLLDRVDQALYQAKHGGRDQIVLAGPPAADPEVPAHILVVDDARTNCRVMAKMLATEPVRISMAGTGRQALDLVQQDPPDLIFLDALMPEMDGFEVCRRLKEDVRTRLIPTVIITSLTAVADRVRGLSCGADDYLSKPVHRSELLARTHSLLVRKRHTDKLEAADGVILTLARALEERDRYTEGHVERVSTLAVRVGQRLSLGPAQLGALRLGGILHDIGKIGISDTILNKKGRLTPEEMEVMKRHPLIGYQILLPLRSFSRVLPIVRWHHERCDGSGYPDGLTGENIPIEARIMAVVDIYDALTTDRPYRSALSRGDARTILEEQAAAGILDRQVVRELTAIVEEPEESTG